MGLFFPECTYLPVRATNSTKMSRNDDSELPT
jgi:hypothetical protein